MARDMPVRWALEEVGQAYSIRSVGFDELDTPAYRAVQPFGQIPVLEIEGIVIFESGAIVLHIADRYSGLLPVDAAARARSIGWVIAALSTIEPPIVEREAAGYAERDQDWFDARQSIMSNRIARRLAQLSARLGDRPWLDQTFSAGDLMVVTVLRRLSDDSDLDPFPNLRDYVARGEARPAFRRAFAAQRALFEARRQPPAAGS
jgi:glutathione S-transferase